MEIRPLKNEDFWEVLSMMEVFYASDALLIHPDAQVLARTLRDSMAGGPYVTGYGFEYEGALAGYGMVSRSYSTEAGGLCLWIEDIYIKPQYRGRGIGTAFLKFVEELGRGSAVRLRLEAEPENTKAMAVYRAAGFGELGYTQLIKELSGENSPK